MDQYLKIKKVLFYNVGNMRKQKHKAVLQCETRTGSVFARPYSLLLTHLTTTPPISNSKLKEEKIKDYSWQRPMLLGLKVDHLATLADPPEQLQGKNYSTFSQFAFLRRNYSYRQSSPAGAQ